MTLDSTSGKHEILLNSIFMIQVSATSITAAIR